MQRRTFGDSKSGLALQLQQTPTVMTLSSRPDPLLLIAVLTALVGVGVIAGVASSPREGILSFTLFALLFLPLICVLTFNAARVRTSCVLDLERNELRIDEQSYMRHIREVHDLHRVQAVTVRRLPAPPLSGEAATYALLIGLPDADYLAAASTNEAAIEQDAQRIARFLDVPVEMAVDGDSERPPARPGVLFTTVVLYVLPVVAATGALVFLFDRLTRFEPSVVGLLGAVVISQLGAMLAYAYYRAHTRREA